MFIENMMILFIYLIGLLAVLAILGFIADYLESRDK